MIKIDMQIIAGLTQDQLKRTRATLIGQFARATTLYRTGKKTRTQYRAYATPIVAKIKQIDMLLGNDMWQECEEYIGG